ncbi:hypothetical protein [Micromonospora fulviviridis]|uniref:hypothetical protein n=1 Tax=Micromonospora fulviviridis TaxID=47860 RepID=UPI00378FD433
MTAYMVAEWTRADGYCDTGIRTDTYAEAEAEAAASRKHSIEGPKSRYVPMSLRRCLELGVVWGGAR